MKISEIVEQVRTADQKRFGQVPEKIANALVVAVLQQITRQIDASADGKLVVQGFGRFAAKQVEREKDGVKVTRKRVLFHAAAPKVPGKNKAARVAARAAKAGKAS